MANTTTNLNITFDSTKWGGNSDQQYPTFYSEGYVGRYKPFLTFGDVSGLISAPVSYLQLFEDGCIYGSGHNCTAVCSDPALLFVNTTEPLKAGEKHKANMAVPYNIYNCLYYPYISNLLVDPRLDNNSKTTVKAMADHFGIVANASSDLISDIISAQASCYDQYCLWQGEDTKCSGYDYVDYTYNTTVGPGMLASQFPDWSGISSVDDMTVNSDIGGIGVSISYMIEFTIIMSAWLILVYLRIFPRDPVGTWWSTKKFTKRSKAEDQDTPEEVLAKGEDPVLCLLIDFQKAQCFFLIALNLAVLIGIYGSAAVIESKNLGQLGRNMTYAQAVTQGGIVFATATLFFVQLCGRIRHRSSYVWVLAFITVSLGAAAWGSAFDLAHPEDLLDTTIATPDTRWLGQCGIISPATYNGEDWSQWTHQNSPWKRLPIVVFCFIVMFGLAVHGMWHKMWFSHVAHPVRQTVRGWGRARRIARQVALGVVEAALLACLCFFVNDYVILMRPSLSTVDKTFGLGQLLALAVWSGTVVDTIHALIRGFGKANEHRYAAKPTPGASGYSEKLDNESGDYEMVNTNLQDAKGAVK